MWDVSEHLFGVLFHIKCIGYVQGSGIHSSDVLNGMVFKRQVEGDVSKADDCKIAVYSCPLDIMQTETKVNRFSLIIFGFLIFKLGKISARSNWIK